MTLPKVQQIPNNHYHWFKTYRSIDWIIPSANPFVHSFVFIRVGQMMPPLHWVSAAMGEQCQTKQMEMYDDVQMWKCHWWMTFIAETSIIFKKPTNCNFRLTNTHLMSSRSSEEPCFLNFNSHSFIFLSWRYQLFYTNHVYHQKQSDCQWNLHLSSQLPGKNLSECSVLSETLETTVIHCNLTQFVSFFWSKMDSSWPMGTWPVGSRGNVFFFQFKATRSCG